jgi:hypothetical protein
MILPKHPLLPSLFGCCGRGALNGGLGVSPNFLPFSKTSGSHTARPLRTSANIGILVILSFPSDSALLLSTRTLLATRCRSARLTRAGIKDGARV